MAKEREAIDSALLDDLLYTNPKGNADTEHFIRSFKEVVVWPNDFASFEVARATIETFFGYYSSNSPHSARASMSPMDFESSLYRQ